VWNYHYELPARFLTLPELLRERGYRTAAFVDAGHMLGLFGFSQGFDLYHDRFERLEGSVRRALDWLDGIDAGDRFFLFVHGYDIHTPYSPWSPYRDLFVDPAYEGGFEPTVKAMGEIGWAARHDPEYVAPLTDADREYVVACYDAAIRWADDLVARLMEGLGRRGRLENTWVIVLSDHGEEFLEHGSVEHDKLYHTVTHVPLIIRPPGRVANDAAGEDPMAAVRGRRVGQVTSLVDVYPTICELAGLGAPGDVEGRSLAPLVSAAALPPIESRAAYSQSWRFGHERAITIDSLHAISSLLGERPLEVFAYRHDRAEQHPLTQDSAEPDSATRALAQRLVEWMKTTAGAMDENVARRLLGSDFETLRSLGYIQ
jgi:arylsulfatase A-like enzyme